MLAYRTHPDTITHNVAAILRHASPEALTLEQIAEQLGYDASQAEILAALRRLMDERRVAAERA